MIIFPGKVVDLPVPKPFQSSSGDSESGKIQGDNKSIDSIAPCMCCYLS